MQDPLYSFLDTTFLRIFKDSTPNKRHCRNFMMPGNAHCLLSVVGLKVIIERVMVATNTKKVCFLVFVVGPLDTLVKFLYGELYRLDL